LDERFPTPKNGYLEIGANGLEKKTNLLLPEQHGAETDG
jgi:hypothetical protein